MTGSRTQLDFKFDQGVTAHYFRARILWLQGFADLAMRVAESNIDDLRLIADWPTDSRRPPGNCEQPPASRSCGKIKIELRKRTSR